MFCRYCGNQLPDDAKFCSKCGNSVTETKPIIHEAEPSKSEITEQEAPKIVEIPKEPTSKIDWATASRLDKELNKPHNPASVMKIVGIICGCFCGVILLFTIFSTIANNSKVENKKPSNTNNITVEENVQPTPIPEPKPEPEEIGVADPREPSTWIYCTGEEEWYEAAMSVGEDFNYDEWLYYEARLENNYDESGKLIIPDDEDDPSSWDNVPDSIYFEFEYFDPTYPIGMFASQIQREYEYPMSIYFVEGDPSKVSIKFYEFWSWWELTPDTEPEFEIVMNASDVVGKKEWTYYFPDSAETLYFKIHYHRDFTVNAQDPDLDKGHSIHVEYNNGKSGYDNRITEKDFYYQYQ